MIFGVAENKELEKFSQILAESTIQLFKTRGEINFSKDPVLLKKNIVDFNQFRMRADGMEKFNNPTFVSSINFFLTPKDLEKNIPIGVLVVYIEQSYVVPLLKKLKYPPVDDEDENALRDCCGTLCNIISGAFKSAVVAAGFCELEMSHFTNYKNCAPNGVPFCTKEFYKYETSFFLDGEKRLVLELSLGKIPRGK